MKKRLLIFLTILFASHFVMAQRDEGLKPKGQVIDNPHPKSGSHYQSEATLAEFSAQTLSAWSGKSWSLSGGVFTTGAYKGGQVSAVTSQAIQLPALGREDQRINAYIEEAFELESYYDKGEVLVSADNGATWKTASLRDGRGDWRTTTVNLTEYAGKSIRLSLRLTADANNQYEGWKVRNVVIKRESLGVADPLTASILSYASRNGRTAGTGVTTLGAGGVTPLGVGNLSGAVTGVDAQRFPTFIFVQAKVAAGGVPLLTLDESNFFVREYVRNTSGGIDTLVVPKDETFLVYKPQDSQTKKLVDIVFLMDNSGSMSPYQTAVANNVNSFVNQLAGTSFDWRLGLCRFGQGLNNGSPIFYNNAAFYSTASDFLTAWNTQTVDGSREPSWDAMFESSTQYSFRAGAQRIFIHITDEAMTGNNLPSSIIQDRQIVINQLVNSSVKLYTLIPNGTAFVSDFGAIATATNGRSYLITSSFNDILTDIANEIQGTYTIRYTPTNKEFDGLKRDVEVKVHDANGNILKIMGEYTPGVAPVVLRTDQTLALHATAQLNNNPMTIQIETLDWNANYLTNRVALFYRTAVPFGTAGTYTEVAMTKGTTVPGAPTRTTWSVTIPANRVVAPGIQYYVRATNKTSAGADYATTTAPEFIDRPGYPFSIAVLPNLPPSVQHTPIVSADPKAAITFNVNAVDNTNSVASVKLYVSTDLGVNFTEYTMTSTGNNNYQYVLPAVGGSGMTVQYYIIVTDNFGVSTEVATRTLPYSIAVGTPWAVTPTSFTHTFRFFKTGLPNAATVTFDGQPLADGDVISAMYDPGNGVLKSAGKLTWSAVSSINTLSVFGDSPGGAKEGYLAGENVIFRIYQKATGQILDAEYEVYPLTTPVTTNVTYGTGKITNMKTLATVSEQAITLDAGYSLWSTYLIPKSSSFADILAPIVSVSPTVADNAGNSYPGGGLTNYASGYGYVATVNSAVTLRVKGNPPASILPVTVTDMGVIIGTPYKADQNVEYVFPPSPSSNIFLVERYLKDGGGNTTIETYSPALEFNEWTYKNMQPGKGYRVSTITGSQSLTLPPYRGAYPNRIAAGKTSAIPQLSQTVSSINRYMNILVTEEAQQGFAVGTEIRVYNATGKIVGKALSQNHGISIVVDGAQVADDEPLTLRTVDKINNVEESLQAIKWTPAKSTLTYENQKPIVLDAARVTALTEKGQEIAIFPNPISSESTLTFKNTSDQHVKIEIFDTQGTRVLNTVADQYFTKGAHAITIQRQSLTPGLYVVKKTSGGSVETTRIMVK